MRIVGIDCHIGSQITQETPYLDAMDRMLDLVTAIEAAGISIHHIDFGGGLGIDYQGDTPPPADTLWAKLLAKLDARGFGQRKLMIEPGRSLVGNAGVCVTEVLFMKPGEQKNFCIVDAAMNDLPRPALYQAYHAIVPGLPSCWWTVQTPTSFGHATPWQTKCAGSGCCNRSLLVATILVARSVFSTRLGASLLTSGDESAHLSVYFWPSIKMKPEPTRFILYRSPAT